jgi:hypothetical protein
MGDRRTRTIFLVGPSTEMENIQKKTNDLIAKSVFFKDTVKIKSYFNKGGCSQLYTRLLNIFYENFVHFSLYVYPSTNRDPLTIGKLD